MKIPEILLISKDEKYIQRLQLACDIFDYSLDIIDSVDDLGEKDNLEIIPLIFLQTSHFTDKTQIAGLVQVTRQLCPDAEIVTILGSKVDPSEAVFIKKSGSDFVLLDLEFITSSKVEYVISQSVQKKFLPVKAADFFVGVKLDFPLFHFLPLNGKYLPLLLPKQELTDSKKKKMDEITEIYIHRKDAEAFHKYTTTLNDKSAEALPRRCRAQYLSLSMTFQQLVFLLTDQSEHASFSEGKKLYEKCRDLAENLLTTLASLGDPWQIVNLSSENEFGRIDRSVSVAAYAGILSLNNSIGEPLEAMMGALFSDLGLLELAPKTNAALIKEGVNGLNAEQLAEYQKHPIFSLNLCLSRKVPFPEKLKNIILMTHERADQKGFPHGKRGDAIPLEAFVVQFCELIDEQTAIKKGQGRKDINVIRKEVYDQEFKSPHRFNIGFLTKINF